MLNFISTQVEPCFMNRTGLGIMS